MSNDRTRLRWIGGLAAMLLPLTAVGCGDDNGGTNPPTTGSLEVSTVTTGSEIDGDGYTVTVDAGAGQAIDANGTLTFSNLSAGDHTVTLSDVAANCTVAGDNPRTLAVSAGSTASTTFEVACVDVTGDVEVTAATTGDDQDDAYTVSVDSGAAQPIAANGMLTISDLTVGSHDVELGDVAVNCTVDGENPRSVNVTAGGTATTTFNVACTSQTADLTIGNTTSGNGSPAGYDYVLDGGAAQPLAANAQATEAGVAVGDHTVELQNVPGNCTVNGDNPRTVNVPVAGATTTFDVTCQAGSLEVTTATTGLGLDADGYSVVIAAGSPQAIGINETVTVPDAGIGDVSVELTGVAANCSVAGDNPRTVTLTDGVTSTTRFEVACFQALTNQIAFETDRDGNREVYVMAPGGSGQQNLTNSASGDGRPDISPSGVAVAFESDRDGTWDIWLLSTSGLVNLTSTVNDDREPSFAGDGSDGIAYTRRLNNSGQIWRMSVIGSGRVALSSTAGDNTQPAFSPDGNWVLFRSDRDGDGEVYVVNVGSGVETRLTTDPADDGKPAWNSAGDAIYWVSNRTGDYEVYTASLAAGAPPVVGAAVNVTNNATGDDLMPDMKPDGSSIAFVSNRGGNNEVYTMAPDGSGQTASTATGDNNVEPSWSP